MRSVVAAAVGLLAMFSPRPSWGGELEPVRLPDGTVLRRVEFDRHVARLFGRLGCDAGSCYGSFQGRGGLNLSLFGADPARDFETIVKADTHPFVGDRGTVPKVTCALGKSRVGVLARRGRVYVLTFGCGRTGMDSLDAPRQEHWRSAFASTKSYLAETNRLAETESNSARPHRSLFLGGLAVFCLRLLP